MINICVQNMIELSIYLFVHTTLSIIIVHRRCSRQIHRQIKKIRVLVAKPELLISCHPNERQSAMYSATTPHGLRITQMSEHPYFC